MGEKGNGFRSASELPAPVTTASVDIPVLRKQDREKKGAGVLLPSSTAATPALTGALGGLSALSGKLTLAALAVAVAGGGYAGYKRFGGAAPRARAASSSDLAPIESTIVVQKRNADGSRSLNFASRAGGSDLRWEDPAQAAAAAAAKAAAEAKAAGAETAKSDAVADDEEAVEEEAPRESKLGRVGGSKLSSDLGGGSRSAAFGKKDIFSGKGGMAGKGMSASPRIDFAGKDFTARGSRGSQIGGLKKGMKALSGNKMMGRKVTASRAMGQLKFSGRTSRGAASSQTGEGGHMQAAAAFDQSSMTGGQLQDGAGGPLGEGLPAIQPGSAGAPDMTGEGGGTQAQACPNGWSQNADGSCTPPTVDQGRNVTPYQGVLEASKQLSDIARQFMILSVILAIAAAAVMYWAPWAGAILLGLSIMFFVMSTDLSEQAKSMGKSGITENYGQEAQGNIAERCADKANEFNHYANCGTTAGEIKRDEIDPKADNTASEDAKAEGDATYQEGGP